MTGSVLWLVVCLAVALVAIGRPHIAVVVYLVLLTSIPFIAAPAVFGESFQGIHGATTLILMTVIVRFLSSPRDFANEFATMPVRYTWLAIFTAAAVLTTAIAGEPAGQITILNQIIAPIGAFVTTRIAARASITAYRWILGAFLGAASLQAVIGVWQFTQQSLYFYVPQYMTIPWYGRGVYFRSTGTMDHPLVLGLFLAIATAALVLVKSNWAVIGLLAVYLAGVLVSQSRIALVAMLVTCGLLVLGKPSPPAVRFVTLVVVGFAGAYFLFSPLAVGVIDRFGDADGSAANRFTAYAWFFEHLGDFIVAGGGSGSSFSVAAQAGLSTSFESALLLYSIDFGLIFALAYFAVQASFAFPLKTHRGVVLIIVVAVLLPQTFSSLAAQSAAGALVWLSLALATVAPGRATERPDPLAGIHRRGRGVDAAN